MVIAAMRASGWVAVGPSGRGSITVTFEHRACARLMPRLRCSQAVLLESLMARESPTVRTLAEQRGGTVRFLPSCSPDDNPIEAARGLVKKLIRTYRPRKAVAPRPVARASRHVVSPYHGRQWFRCADYVNSTAHRD